MPTKTAPTVHPANLLKLVKLAPERLTADRLILAHGVFDLFHPGHILHLREAKSMGELLAVSITADKYISKGPGRPCYNQEQRAAMLSALSFVDMVVIVDDPSAVPAIQGLRPAIYVKGPDYAARNVQNGKFALEKAAVEAIGGRVAFTSAPAMSSTAIINSQRERPIKASLEDVLGWLDKVKAIKAEVIGEHITDWYTYVEPVGKAPKEELVVYRQVGDETFQGGAAIMQAHLAEAIGAVYRYPSKPIVKHRYVSKPFLRKVYEVVSEPHETPPLYPPDAFGTDLVVVADYGHGLIRGKSRAKMITDRAKFLALTCQSNGLNWGFNLLTKWPRANYFVVDEQELRLAKSDRWTPIQDLLCDEFTRLGAQVAAVTRGHLGCMVYDGNAFTTVPPVADKVVDRMGAGDAFLAWTVGLAFLGAPADIIGFVGNVAGGIKVGLVGNQPVTAKEVRIWVKSLLG